MFSRRGFFEYFTHLAENPQKARERRVAELRAWALECASLDWSAEQREETARDVERKLSYLSDESLRQENMKKYVENIVRTKDMFYAAQRAEQDYLRRHQEDSEYDGYPYGDNEEN
jgi:hypothetical protein